MASSTFLSVIFLAFSPQLTNPGFIPTSAVSSWGMGVRGKARGQEMSCMTQTTVSWHWSSVGEAED